MSQLFDEIDEDVRRDQLKKLWEKYSVVIIAGAILIIASVGGWRGYQYVEARKAAEAGAAFDKAVELADANKHTEAEAAFAELVAKAPFGYRTLSRDPSAFMSELTGSSSKTTMTTGVGLPTCTFAPETSSVTRSCKS